MYIDVHCHLETCENVDEIISRAKERGVNIIIANGVDVESNRKVLEFAQKYAEVKAALGLHPTDTSKLSSSVIKKEIDFIKENKKRIVAIGEAGLDFTEKDKNKLEKQKRVFQKLILLSIELGIPLIVHSRKAEEECIEILEKNNAKKVIMHHFSGKIKLAEKVAGNGWMLSIPSSIKYSEHFQKIVEKTPIENLLCETDTPFMHPEKDFPNEPANVVISYKKISEIKGINLKDVSKKIESNFRKIFD